MEFNEKLQQLRKQNNLTQEQLGEQLYVSRTAISKWESGKGYPNIESLRSISKLFSVSIDDLLSGDELITLAETENRSNMDKIYSMIYEILDLMAIAFIFLPLYGKPEGTYIRAVNLFAFTNTLSVMLIIYWAIFIAIIGLGVVQFISAHLDKERWQKLFCKCSFILQTIAICFFAAAREPYVTTLLFLFLIVKIGVLIKSIRMK